MGLESKSVFAGTEQIRLFIAIPVPDEVCATLRQVQSGLKKLLSDKAAVWTKPDGMHLTLRFLGNVNSERIPELSQRLSGALAGLGRLDLVCERLGCFPDLRFPRVVWAWVHDDAERLARLHRRIDEAVGVFAEKPTEARFVGHITLARLKQVSRRDAGLLARFVEGAGHRRFGDWHVNSVALIRSHLSAAGATHEELLQTSLL